MAHTENDTASRQKQLLESSNRMVKLEGSGYIPCNCLIERKHMLCNKKNMLDSRISSARTPYL